MNRVVKGATAGSTTARARTVAPVQAVREARIRREASVDLVLLACFALKEPSGFYYYANLESGFEIAADVFGPRVIGLRAVVCRTHGIRLRWVLC